jgi:hypothetical protein
MSRFSQIWRIPSHVHLFPFCHVEGDCDAFNGQALCFVTFQSPDWCPVQSRPIPERVKVDVDAEEDAAAAEDGGGGEAAVEAGSFSTRLIILRVGTNLSNRLKLS